MVKLTTNSCKAPRFKSLNRSEDCGCALFARKVSVVSEQGLSSVGQVGRACKIHIRTFIGQHS